MTVYYIFIIMIWSQQPVIIDRDCNIEINQTSIVIKKKTQPNRGESDEKIY